MSPPLLALHIKAHASQLGFDHCGITGVEPPARASHYKAWLDAGHAGDMRYLARGVHLREHPAELLPGARSIICLAVNYRRPAQSDLPAREGAAPPSAGRPANSPDEPGPSRDRGETAPPATGRIAQYARGFDYHRVLREMMKRLILKLQEEQTAPFGYRMCVDTSPVLERELAARAGLGWIGKNTLLLNASLGSYLFLGEIITTLDAAFDAPATDHCGTCTRCLEACPTQAFLGPNQLDARRCISYLTIEHRGEIAPELQPAIGDWLYGCDVCQEVCPHNQRAPAGAQPKLMANRLPERLALTPLVTLTTGGHRRLTLDTAAARARPAMWRRNAAIVLQNQS